MGFVGTVARWQLGPEQSLPLFPPMLACVPLLQDLGLCDCPAGGVAGVRVVGAVLGQISKRRAA